VKLKINIKNMVSRCFSLVSHNELPEPPLLQEMMVRLKHEISKTYIIFFIITYQKNENFPLINNLAVRYTTMPNCIINWCILQELRRLWKGV
ncbi:uncharacterized protein METZ01_LOCUS439414, partial [marine metagenome]